MVSFNCSTTGDVATFVLASTKTIVASVTIDGGGKITLSGNNAHRLFQVDDADGFSPGILGLLDDPE